MRLGETRAVCQGAGWAAGSSGGVVVVGGVGGSSYLWGREEGRRGFREEDAYEVAWTRKRRFQLLEQRRGERGESSRAGSSGETEQQQQHACTASLINP